MLRGDDGERRIVSDALGQPISLERRAARPSPGKDIELTLDAAIQDKVE